MNIIQTIQKNLGYDELHKIDPNTQDIKASEKVHGNHALSQAAIPAVLTGLFSKLDNKQDNNWLFNESGADWLDLIFGKKANEVVERVVAYSKASSTHARQNIEHIAVESARVIRNELGTNRDENNIEAFVAAHKREVLLYLPPALQLGSLLENNNLDDRTNKMEGPVSSFMNKLEKQFNSSENN